MSNKTSENSHFATEKVELPTYKFEQTCLKSWQKWINSQSFKGRNFLLSSKTMEAPIDTEKLAVN